jgi:hypothetical protein
LRSDTSSAGDGRRTGLGQGLRLRDSLAGSAPTPKRSQKGQAGGRSFCPPSYHQVESRVVSSSSNPADEARRSLQLAHRRVETTLAGPASNRTARFRRGCSCADRAWTSYKEAATASRYETSRVGTRGHQLRSAPRCCKIPLAFREAIPRETSGVHVKLASRRSRLCAIILQVPESTKGAAGRTPALTSGRQG